MRLTEDEDTVFDPREEELILRETAELRADDEDELELRVADAIFELRVAEDAAFELRVTDAAFELRVADAAFELRVAEGAAFELRVADATCELRAVDEASLERTAAVLRLPKVRLLIALDERSALRLGLLLAALRTAPLVLRISRAFDIPLFLCTKVRSG